MNAIVRVRDLHKYFGDNEVLKGISVDIHEGDTLVVVGASGSGKSTFLRCLNFLEFPNSGTIEFLGKEVGTLTSKGRIYKESELCELRSHIGMVFQQYNLFPHMTALQNVMEGPLTVKRMDKQSASKIAIDQLERVGLVEKADQYPSRLSGGQQQRVAIARALAMSPSLMLFDEPTSALDPELVEEVLLEMGKLSKEGMPMIVVTHELGFAYHVANRIVFFHDGLIHEEGSPHDILLHPQKERTIQFFKGHSSLPAIKTET